MGVGMPEAGSVSDTNPINQARPSQLADVATYRPDDAGGERDRHPEHD